MSLTIDKTSYRSQNYNSRNGKPISMIMLHTTEGDFDSDAEWMCAERSQVSCHYLVAPDGEVYQLVADKHRAWHAGSGSWNGVYDANSYSIGIEVSHKGGRAYGRSQWDVTAELCSILIASYSIVQTMICAHRWYAQPPGRKSDPTDVSDPELRRWIAALYDGAGVWKNVTADMVNVREGPGTQYDVALEGIAQVAPGQQFEVDDLTPSDDPRHPQDWLHLSSQIGFVYSPYCVMVPA